MRVAEKRSPQDGRYEPDLGGFAVDLRVSSIPTRFGEKIVLRVLAKDQVPLDLEALGFTGSDFETTIRNLQRPFGMILVTGPTGSGKSTSLYAMVIRVGAQRQSLIDISTIEDPIEYTIPRVSQVQFNPGAGVDFSTGLRALLRQDPDVIMLGEIRDRDSADMAVRAAIKAAAVAGGMKTMFQDGLAKVLLGETTLEEVFRVAI